MATELVCRPVGEEDFANFILIITTIALVYLALFDVMFRDVTKGRK